MKLKIRLGMCSRCKRKVPVTLSFSVKIPTCFEQQWEIIYHELDSIRCKGSNQPPECLFPMSKKHHTKLNQM